MIHMHTVHPLQGLNKQHSSPSDPNFVALSLKINSAMQPFIGVKTPKFLHRAELKPSTADLLAVTV